MLSDPVGFDRIPKLVEGFKNVQQSYFNGGAYKCLWFKQHKSNLSWFALNALVKLKPSCDKYLQESKASQIEATI